MASDQIEDSDKDRLTSAKAPDDALYIWRFFSDRLEELKDKLWTQMTWLLGLVGALIVYILDRKIVSWSGNALQVEAWPALILGMVGITLSLFGVVLVWEVGRHIKGNEGRQTRAASQIPGLNYVLTGEPSPNASAPQQSKGKSLFIRFWGLPLFCRILIVISTGYVIVFGLCAVVALARLRSQM